MPCIRASLLGWLIQAAVGRAGGWSAVAEAGGVGGVGGVQGRRSMRWERGGGAVVDRGVCRPTPPVMNCAHARSMTAVQAGA